MATYTWSIPDGKAITGLTYIKDTDNNIADTINDLVDFVNGEGNHAGQGLTYDLVSTNTAQTITGVKTFSNNIVGNLTGTVTGDVSGNANTATALATARDITLLGDVTGTASFDGSANLNITATVANDSHTHDSMYYTEAEVDAMVSGLNSTIGTDTDISTSGNTVISGLTLTEGVITSSSTRNIDYDDVGALADVGHLFSTNGYQKLSNGLWIVWGRHNVVSVDSTINFPISFPTSCLSLSTAPTNGTLSSADDPYLYKGGVKTISKTGFTWYNSYAAQNDGITYIAIGY